jgi:hypothetical protein
MPRRAPAHYDHIERAINDFPTYHITFFSIIQSVVFGYLLLAIKDELTYALAGGSPNPVWISLTFVAFLLIIAIWQEYIVGSIVFRWAPGLPDAMIPVLFGLTESLVVFSISFQQMVLFYFSLSSVCVIAFLQYVNLIRESNWHFEKNRAALELSRELYRINEIWIFVYAVAAFFFGLSEAIWRLNSFYLAIFIVLCLVAWLIRGHIFWKRLFEESPKED